MGLSRSIAAKWKATNTKPSADILPTIANYFGVSVDYLLGIDETKKAPTPEGGRYVGNDALLEQLRKSGDIIPIETRLYPLLGSIACGEPIYAEENFEAYVEARAHIEADFCLRARGDSMTGARILDGDIVFIKNQSMVDNGEIAAVVIENEATLKRVNYYPEKNLLILKADNPRYADLIYSGEQLDHITILGKAVAFQSDVR